MFILLLLLFRVIVCLFVFHFWLMISDKFSCKRLNKSGEERDSCLLLKLRRSVFKVSPIWMLLLLGSLWVPFNRQTKMSFLFLVWWKFIFYECVFNLIQWFFYSCVDDHAISQFFMLNHLYIPGLNYDVEVTYMLVDLIC